MATGNIVGSVVDVWHVGNPIYLAYIITFYWKLHNKKVNNNNKQPNKLEINNKFK